MRRCGSKTGHCVSTVAFLSGLPSVGAITGSTSESDASAQVTFSNIYLVKNVCTTMQLHFSCHSVCTSYMFLSTAQPLWLIAKALWQNAVAK